MAGRMTFGIELTSVQRGGSFSRMKQIWYILVSVIERASSLRKSLSVVDSLFSSLMAKTILDSSGSYSR